MIKYTDVLKRLIGLILIVAIIFLFGHHVVGFQE